MAKKIKAVHWLLSDDEYQELIHPDKTYSLMTKTAANNAVKGILRTNKSKCWIERQKTDEFFEPGDWCCSMCPVMKLLGHDAGDRICLHEKQWSQ